jgi:hypothetical protein
MAETAKRPPKARIVQFTISLFGLLAGGHIDQATVTAQLKNSGMFLYTGEVDKIAEKETESNPNFDGEGYAQMLFDADALVEGAAPVFGGSGARINSKERALQVANDPANADLIVELISEAIAIKNKVNKLVSDNAVFSYALKNKKADEETVETEDEMIP